MVIAHLQARRLSATRRVLRVFLLIACVLGLVNNAPVLAAETGERASETKIQFGIPSQALGSALEAYARIASREVLYDGALAAGRRSSSVEGVYTPETALEILLAGSGLWASSKDAEFFVVGLASAEQPASAAASSQSAAQLRYYARVQEGLRAEFCGDSALPNGTRVAARLWVGQSGRVLQAKRLSSTGNDELDRQVEAGLRRLDLGASPPADFAQPITILVIPSGPGKGQSCDVPRARPLIKAGP